MNDKQALNL